MPDPTSESAKARLDNANPTLHETAREREVTDSDWTDSIKDPIDAREVFDLIRSFLI